MERLEGGSHTSAGEHRMGVGDPVVGGREAWIVPQCFFEALNALAYARFRTPVPEMATPKIQLVRLRIDRPRLVAIQTPPLMRRQLDLDFPGDGPGHVRLHLEHIVKAALVALSPQVRFIADPDELSRDSHTLPYPAHGAFQDMRYTKLAADLRD